MSSNEYTIYAVKTIQHREEGGEYWIPRLYEEIKNGGARFGWGWFEEANLIKIKSRIDANEWNKLSEGEKEVWGAASFLLGVQSGDYFVYINMPEYGKCSIVRIRGVYRFEDVWDSERRGDFRHMLSGEFVNTFDRNSAIVPPYLSKRLKLMGAWYRIYAPKEFEELLDDLKKGGKGKTAKERLKQQINSRLLEITEQTYRNFPDKNLEDLLRLEVFPNLPNVKNVRKGPDVNGADLEVEFESGLEIVGIQRTEKCAVQVKAYTGAMGYDRAIKDIKRAFESDPTYTCGWLCCINPVEDEMHLIYRLPTKPQHNSAASPTASFDSILHT